MQPNALISGQSVVFKLQDAVCPDFSETLRAIGPELRVTGNIVFFSDGGEQKAQFAIVEVAGMHTPLIVPVRCLDIPAGMTEDQPWTRFEESARKAG